MTESVTYELHCICYRVYLTGICVDFEYDPDSRVYIFDAWRLHAYACELPKRNQEYWATTSNDYIKLEKSKKYLIQHITYISFNQFKCLAALKKKCKFRVKQKIQALSLELIF